MAYEQLPIVEVDVDDLGLDLENYRIPTKRGDEASALKYLFASENVMGAALLILRDGYFDNEVPIVIAEEGGSGKTSYIVLEGNRRVSALKALNDPTLIPGHEQDVRTLLKRYAVEAQNLPKRIRVLVATDRVMAAPHIARLHTGLSKKPWSLDQQATFYYSLLDDETTVEGIKAQYPGVNVVRFIKMAVMRRFLAAAPFSDHSLRQYAASDDLRMSAFEYAYRNKDIASSIGVAFNKDGSLVPASLPAEKVAATLMTRNLGALEFLLSEFRAGRLNTRSLEFKKASEEHEKFLARISDSRISPAAPVENLPSMTSAEPVYPQPSAVRGEYRGAANPVNSPKPTPSPVDAANRGPNHPDTRDVLDLSGLAYESAPLNLKLRYFELRKISLSNLPTATAILLRSVLESTIKVHFESSSTPVTGELNAVFAQVSRSYGSVKALRNTINSIQSGNAQKPGSIQWFNLVAHSSDAAVSADDVREGWKLVGPIIRHLLRPPVQQASLGN
ncbi:hypothetical protein [Arthrobacter sp. R4-81]